MQFLSCGEISVLGKKILDSSCFVQIWFAFITIFTLEAKPNPHHAPKGHSNNLLCLTFHIRLRIFRLVFSVICFKSFIHLSWWCLALPIEITVTGIFLHSYLKRTGFCWSRHQNPSVLKKSERCMRTDSRIISETCHLPIAIIFWRRW